MNIFQQPLTSQIYYLGANDHQIKKFESLWEIELGISYNCYLIIDQFTALIDSVETHFGDELLNKLQQLLGARPLNYLIINHMEPDHSGTLIKLKQAYPHLTIIGNHKTIQMAEGFYGLKADAFQEIKEGETLKLGSHQLRFIMTPMAHWPESMVSYETTNEFIFSSDLFGGYQAVNEQPLFEHRTDQSLMINQAREYFATVLGNYTRPALASLKKLKQLRIKGIAPAHGLIWQAHWPQIFDLYWRWSKYLPDQLDQRGVSIIVGSMYGHTLEMGQLLAKELEARGFSTDLFDASQATQTKILGAIWKNRGLIVGSCTYANGLFPPVKNLLDQLIERKIKNKVLGIFGSHSWTGGAERYLLDFATQSKLPLLKPIVTTQYRVGEQAQKQLIELAASFQSHFETLEEQTV